MFLAAIVLIGGGIGGAVALTGGAAAQFSEVAVVETPSPEAENSSPAPTPVTSEASEPSAEPTSELPPCDSACSAQHVSDYLAGAKLATRARSASDPRLCLESNCGVSDGGYCILGAGALVLNCIVWNGWGDGWLDLYAQGQGVDPSTVFIVESDPGNGIRLSPGERVSYIAT